MSIDPNILTQIRSAPSAMQRAQTAAASEKAGIVFYRFQGRPIATTRPWCLAREGKVWHIEEIREWGRQAASGVGWDGMVEGTNEQTIMTYLGGWYGNRESCRHVLVPVLPSRVPSEDMERMRAKGLIDNTPQQTPGVDESQSGDSETLNKLRESWRSAVDDKSSTNAQHESLIEDYRGRIAPNLSTQQEASLKHYTSGASDEINAYLRRSPGDRTGDLGRIDLEAIRGVRSALASNPLREAQTVYRGITDSKAARRFAELIKKTATGTEIGSEGFMSTSLRADLTFMQRSEVVLRIRVPAGSRAVYLGDISNFGFERELLLDTGMRFRILGHEVVNGKTLIDLIAIL